MKNIGVLLLVLLFAFDSNAEIRVYNPQTGEQKSINYLEDNGAFKKDFEDLTPEQKNNLTKQELIKYMKQAPDSHKPIEKQKSTGLGTVIYFTSVDTIDEEQGKVMTKISEIDDVRTQVYIKEYQSSSEAFIIGMKLNGSYAGELETDPRNKNARRLHVDSYPQMIYVAPDGSMARYSGSLGGLTALKMKIGEVKTILEEQAKQKAEAASLKSQPKVQALQIKKAN